MIVKTIRTIIGSIVIPSATILGTSYIGYNVMTRATQKSIDTEMSLGKTVEEATNVTYERFREAIRKSVS